MMTRQIAFLVLLSFGSVLIGMQEISQNKVEISDKKIEYVKGHGLDFEWPLGERERKHVAQEIVKSLDKQQLTLNDLLKDHLKKKGSDFAKETKDFKFLKREPYYIEKAKGFLEKEPKTNVKFKKKSIVFDNCFSQSLQAFVRNVFKEEGMNYPIEVKRGDEQAVNQTEIRSMVQLKDPVPVALSLVLRWSLWGDEDQCRNIVENDPLRARAILSHEAVHARELQGVKLKLLNVNLSALNYNKEEKIRIQLLANTVYEHEADLMPCMKSSTRVCMEHLFKKEISPEYRHVPRQSEYLSLNDLSKIVSLFEVKRRDDVKKFVKEFESFTNHFLSLTPQENEKN